MSSTQDQLCSEKDRKIERTFSFSLGQNLVIQLFYNIFLQYTFLFCFVLTRTEQEAVYCSFTNYDTPDT